MVYHFMERLLTCMTTQLKPTLWGLPLLMFVASSVIKKIFMPLNYLCLHDIAFNFFHVGNIALIDVRSFHHFFFQSRRRIISALFIFVESLVYGTSGQESVSRFYSAALPLLAWGNILELSGILDQPWLMLCWCILWEISNICM